jgi:drug/metabolite transporter (DMT)-like permease
VDGSSANRSRHLLRVHAAVLLFGLAAVLGKLLDLPSVVIVFGRVVVASLALAAASACLRLPLRPRSRGNLLGFAALGALLAVHWTTFFQSVLVSGVAVALITFLTFPVFVALLEPLFFRERLRAPDVVLAVVALAGVAILKPGEGTAEGVLWGVASGVTFAFLTLLNRKFVRQHSGVTIALYQDVFAALALLPFVVLQRPAVGAREVLLLLVLGLLCTALAHALFISGMRGVNARAASTIACLEPVYGSALAVPLLGEVPTVRTLVGGLIVLGVALYATLSAGRGQTEGGRPGGDAPLPEPPPGPAADAGHGL